MSVYLIDGYNLLHQILRAQDSTPRRSRRSPRRGAGRREVPAEDTGDTAVAERGPLIDLDDERRRLLDGIASFMGGTSDRAVVVFDSREETLERSESATAQVDVYFGSFSRSADSIIEREVYALSPGESVIVVSSDYQLQKTIFLPNVVRLSSRQFATELHKDKKRIANCTNRITMNLRVEERIPSDTLKQLSRLRDGLQEDDR